MRAWEERLADLGHPALELRRPRDHEGPRALGGQHRIHQNERDATAVIAVEVGQEDRVDRVVLNALLRQGDQGRRAEVDRDP